MRMRALMLSMTLVALMMVRIFDAEPYTDSKSLIIEKLELGSPGPGEVLVRIKAAGLCHSDLSVINGNRPRPTLTHVLGHEVAGIVEEIGPFSSDFAVGDHVVFVFRSLLWTR